MINPAEEIVNVWLQDHHKYFMMSNIVVPKKTRLNSKGGKLGGGKGKEIDFLATNGKGNYYWVEVSVSPSPRLPSGMSSSRKEIVDDILLKKFAAEKRGWITKNSRKFRIKTLEKWFVYSPNLFSKKSDGEKKFCERFKRRGVRAVSFLTVLKDAGSELNYFGYDSPRQYIFLFKKMGYKMNNHSPRRNKEES